MITMFPPAPSLFQSRRTQQLYNILQSLPNQPAHQPQPKPIKILNQPHTSRNNKFSSFITPTLFTPKISSQRKWTVQSSQSKGSNSKQKKKMHPLTSNKKNTFHLYFKSKKFKQQSKDNHITVVDFNHSADQTIITHFNKSSEKKNSRNKNSDKIKSKLFTKKQLQSVKKTLQLEEIQRRQQFNVYFDGSIPHLSKCLQDRNYLNVTNDIGKSSFLWINLNSYESLMFDQIRFAFRHGKKEQKYLISHIPIDLSKIMIEISKETEKMLPKTIQLKRNNAIDNHNQVLQFVNRFQQIRYWILKPVSQSNCNNSYIFKSNQQIKEKLKLVFNRKNNLQLEYICQQYIFDPFLYNNRKFSIKAYLLITHINQITKGFFYNKLSIQTSSLEYKIQNRNVCAHFTGNQIQRQSKFYGKYEENNQIDESALKKQIQHTLKNSKTSKIHFKQKMKETAQLLVQRMARQLEKRCDAQEYFELFSMDFLLQQDLSPILIGIERDPNLRHKHMRALTQQLIQNALRLTLDIRIPPSLSFFAKGQFAYKTNYFENIYDSKLLDYSQMPAFNIENSKINSK